MASHLSKEDVSRLLKEPSPHIRAEIASKLAQEIDSPRLTESEFHLAQEIMQLMAKDVEETVRRSLAQSLRHAVKLPHDVAIRLARDVESVANPILENSTVLTDVDLIDIIKEGSSSKHEAIAGRTNVSTQVSDVLITTAGEKAVSVLMNNITAQISEQSFDKAVNRFTSSDIVKEAMVKRAVLPITIAERLTAIVSEKLKDYLVAHHDLSSTVASDLILRGREHSVIGLTAGSSEQDIEKLVAQMFANKRLTPSIVLRALCMGEVRFFESALAIMANVPLLNARILIHDGGQLGLKTLYDKASMPQGLLPVVRAALDVVHEVELDGGQNDIERYRARVIERVLTQFEDINSEDVDYLLLRLGDIMTSTEAETPPL
jgi:uncharacterized protein (DUF2336 family)